MGQSKDLYGEIVTAEFERKQFENLCLANNLKAGIDYKIKNVEVPEFNYAEYEIWVLQKSKSTKEYKKLKEIEFNLRNQ